MNWYLVKIVFRVLIAGDERTAHFDEQLRLIQAASKETAFSKACEIGMSEEANILNVNNQRLVQWQFINVSMLYRISELLDGAEIGAVTKEPPCAADYIEMIHQKAAGIRNDQTLEILQLV